MTKALGFALAAACCAVNLTAQDGQRRAELMGEVGDQADSVDSPEFGHANSCRLPAILIHLVYVNVKIGAHNLVRSGGAPNRLRAAARNHHTDTTTVPEV